MVGAAVNKEDAEEFTQSLRQVTSGTWQVASGSWRQIALAKKLGVPKALGLTVEEWVKTRIGGYMRLSIEDRKEAAVTLVTDEGYSTRETAEILGVSHQTVARDVTNVTPDEPEADSVSDDAQLRSLKTDLEQANKKAEQLRKNLNTAQQQAVTTDCDKRYGTIVIDPPWPMQKIEREVRPNQVEFDYPTMDEDQLRDFRVQFARLADEHCHVFMWTTHKFMPMAMRLFQEYGVKYVLTMVWHKPGGFQPVGLPQYNCEFVLYGRIGSPQFTTTKAFNCCFEAPRREHSRKPDEFYELVCRVTGDSRIDVFSRERRDGFDRFGNEIDKFAEAS